MSDTPLPPRQHKKFLGRDFTEPPPRSKIRADAALDVMPPPLPGAAAPAAPPAAAPAPPADAEPARGRVLSEREQQFRRYADLRQQMTGRPRDVALLAEAAKAAETLCLTIEAMELWRECLRLDPMHPAAPQRLVALDRRAAATGETGGEQKSTYRPRDQAPESPPFWTDLGSVLAFPFRGRGFGVFVGASVFFAVGEILSTFNVFFGWFVMLCLFGYLAAWHFDVLSRTAAGKDDPPEFPELVTVVDSCVMPFLGLASCVLFAFAPMIVIAALTIQGTLSPGAGAVASMLAMVPCGFAFPMTLTVRALTQSSADAMNPARVYGSIVRILPDYLVAFVSLGALWFGWSLVRAGLLLGVGLTFGMPTADAVIHLDWLRIVGWLVYTALVWPLLLYVWCVQGHLLGCLYRQSYRRLAWFVAAGPETARAAPFSARVALAGAGGAALLAAGAWITYAVWPGDRANSFVSGSAAPFGPGTTLTYYWENTDGPAGTATYTFAEDASGRAAVTAAYRHAGDLGITSSRGTVGVVDLKSGAVVRADGEEAGIRLEEKAGRHTRFYGPKRGSTNSTYLNDWQVRGETRFRGAWDTWRVVDPDTSTELYYDKATGMLVGRKFSGVGFTVTEWLTEAKGVAGIGRCPPANRSFEIPEPKRRSDEQEPDIFGPPPEDR
jgi:hypothetical protein